MARRLLNVDFWLINKSTISVRTALLPDVSFVITCLQWVGFRTLISATSNHWQLHKLDVSIWPTLNMKVAKEKSEKL